MLNPRFQGFLHGILCDEVVRGIFVCFMVHASSGFILLATYCIFPCAAYAKVKKSSTTSTKVAPEEGNDEPKEIASEKQPASPLEALDPVDNQLPSGGLASEPPNEPQLRAADEESPKEGEA